MPSFLSKIRSTLKVPEDQARLLLPISCRAVADELHLRESSLTEMDMHIILGEKEEGFGYAEHSGVPTLFLREWDERKFVTAALSFAVQKSINQHRQEQIIADILHRYRQIGPISADHLHNSVAPPGRLPLEQRNNRLNGTSDATVSDIGRTSLPKRRDW